LLYFPKICCVSCLPVLWFHLLCSVMHELKKQQTSLETRFEFESFINVNASNVKDVGMSGISTPHSKWFHNQLFNCFHNMFFFCFFCFCFFVFDVSLRCCSKSNKASKCRYQAGKVSGHVFECQGIDFAYFYDFYGILELFWQWFFPI
jgi:hypothetical protein